MILSGETQNLMLEVSLKCHTKKYQKSLAPKNLVPGLILSIDVRTGKGL
jgi:hypothetical protein